jgi:uncharacterized protein YdcH (DUF465 family)
LKVRAACLQLWKIELLQSWACGTFNLPVTNWEVCWMLTPKDQLLASHDEFRRLAQEHMQYAQRLDSLTQKRYLTEDEKLEEVRLKKLKLRLKDQMENIQRQFRLEHQVA